MRSTLLFKKFFKTSFALGLLISSSCGPQYNPQSLPNYICYPSEKDYSACCVGHGGPNTSGCGIFEYKFSSTYYLVCSDNTVSSTCTQ